jgi:hypothetical protein
LRLHSLFHRRPSAAIVISVTALFMSLGGVGYAAVSIPNNSVGQKQLKNNAVSYKKIVPNAVGAVRLANGGVTNDKLANGSVSYKKIQPGAVGTVRANLNQLQARVSASCAAGSAIGAVANNGKPTCNATLPQEYGTANGTANLSAANANVATVALPAGATYVAFANPTISVTSSATAQRTTVTCALTVGTNTQTRVAVVPTNGTSGTVSTASLPLQVSGPAGASAIACSAKPNTGTLPTTVATAQINALQTAANNG